MRGRKVGGSHMKKKLSVIIAAHNEVKTIGPLVRRLSQWQRRPEVIVVANGCTDGTARIAKRNGARVIRFSHKLGPDIGRAIGLSIATGDYFLVMDADMLIPLRQLEPFVRALERGTDIALNRYPFWGTPQYQHPTAIAKHALNLFTNRKDLRAASLTAVPHGISRRAVNRLGPFAFCVPPVAQARAICANLRVELAGGVGVGAINRWRNKAHRQTMQSLIIGDCLEAMSVVIKERGTRGGFTDLNRRRDLLDPVFLSEQPKVRKAVIIPTLGEDSLSSLVRHLRSPEIEQIRVVLNGMERDLYDASQLSSTVEIDYYDERVGHDVGRAIGCMQVAADAYFITDADIPLSAKDVQSFFDAVNSDVDVALNDLNRIIARPAQVDPPSIVKRFLNIAVGRRDLGVASLTAVPHAISGQCLQNVGIRAFAVPPLAQVEAILAGYRVAAVHGVDVIRTNATRPELHNAQGRPLEKLIVGDHLEAVARLQEVRGARVSFKDNVRRRDIAIRFIGRRYRRTRVGSFLRRATS